METTIKAIVNECIRKDSPVSEQMVRDALGYAVHHDITLSTTDDWLDIGLGAVQYDPADEVLGAIASEHFEDILDYMRRMHKYGGEDVPLVYPLTDAVYAGVMGDGVTRDDPLGGSVDQVLAAWFTWVREVLVMQADFAPSEEYNADKFGELFKHGDKYATVGFWRDDGDFQVLATLNNADDLMTDGAFAEWVNSTVKQFKLLAWEVQDEVRIYARQDAPDYLTDDGASL